MARIRIPYLVRKRNPRGGVRWYWQADDALRTAGWPLRRLAQGVADPEQARAAAVREAQEINRQVAEWRAKQTVVMAPAGLAACGQSVDDLIKLYRASRFYKSKRASTRRGYEQNLEVVSRWAGDQPVSSVRTKDVQRFYEQLLASSAPGRANPIIGMVRILFEFGVREAVIAVNPALRPGLVGRPRTSRMWSREAVSAFVAAADRLGLHSIGTAVALDEWLGQREGDLLALPRGAYREGEILVTQSKTGERVALPVAMVPALVARLEAELERQRARGLAGVALLLAESTGRPWKSDHFRHAFARVRAAAVADAALPGWLAAELRDARFMHLRHTAATRLAEAGATVPQIAAITGHAIASIEQILERYLVRTRELAKGGFALRLKKEAVDAG